ncbi:cytochrome P450 2A5 [Bombina bombina]|uniref:cytochrome P450 2A5 n=1 Tax=Bombina bombina TaxID=8345 RepID=UPI00235B06CE|nr:cytochrome P450 2A5 [Bombina bombina]
MIKMDFLLAIIIVGFCSCVVLWMVHNSSIRRRLPPGPTPLPFLGNILQIKRRELVTFLKEMRCQYGDIFTVYLGPKPVVVVSGYQFVKEALLQCDDAFIGRGETPCLDASYKNFGFVFTNNLKRWRELRRFSLKILKDLGMGKKGAEEKIIEEAQHLVKELRKNTVPMFNPNDFLIRASSNVVCALLFGQTFDYDEKDMWSLIHGIHDTFYLMSTFSGQLYSMFPGIMKYLPGNHQKIFKNMDDLMSFIDTRVQKNQKTLDINSPRDYIDAFLIKMEKEKENPNTEFNMINLVCNALQIFFAGAETTSTTLKYGFLLLLKHPGVQEKIHKEIDIVIGRDRSPRFEDKSQMPYTDAVIHEILRFSDLVPFSMPRAVTKDIKFHGYTIPKNTTSFLLLTSVLHDPALFPNPESFNPKNFLDDYGRFKKNDAFLAFAAGKRTCFGESLARMELFIFFTTVLQNFKLSSPIHPEDLDITPSVSGIGNFPRPYKLCIGSR